MGRTGAGTGCARTTRQAARVLRLSFLVIARAVVVPAPHRQRTGRAEHRDHHGCCWPVDAARSCSCRSRRRWWRRSATTPRTKILYIGTMAASSALLTLLSWAVGRDRSLRDTDASPDQAPAAASVVGVPARARDHARLPGDELLPAAAAPADGPAVQRWRGTRAEAVRARPLWEDGRSPTAVSRALRVPERRRAAAGQDRPRDHPQLLHHRAHRPRQVDAGRPDAPAHRGRRRARGAGAVPRPHGHRARARHHDQEPGRPDAVDGAAGQRRRSPSRAPTCST